MQTFYAADDSNAALEDLYNEITGHEAGGGTNIYVAAREALEIACSYDLDQYTPAIILMTDGRSLEGMREFEQAYENAGEDVPVFSITFGDADPNQLEDLAGLTGGRVFDGTDNLTEAFRSVKGYN